MMMSLVLISSIINSQHKSHVFHHFLPLTLLLYPPYTNYTTYTYIPIYVSLLFIHMLLWRSYSMTIFLFLYPFGLLCYAYFILLFTLIVFVIIIMQWCTYIFVIYMYINHHVLSFLIVATLLFWLHFSLVRENRNGRKHLSGVFYIEY